MKTTTTITLDVDVMAATKMKVPNLSGQINALLKSYLGRTDSKGFDNLDKAQNEIVAKTVELAKLQEQAKKLEKKADDEKPVVERGYTGHTTIRNQKGEILNPPKEEAYSPYMRKGKVPISQEKWDELAEEEAMKGSTPEK